MNVRLTTRRPPRLQNRVCVCVCVCMRAYVRVCVRVWRARACVCYSHKSNVSANPESGMKPEQCPIKFGTYHNILQRYFKPIAARLSEGERR